MINSSSACAVLADSSILQSEGFLVLNLLFNARGHVSWSSIPVDSGVYAFLDENGRAVYVGQASKLNNRVRHSYRRLTKEAKVVTIAWKAVSIHGLDTVENRLISELNPLENGLTKGGKVFLRVKSNAYKEPKIQKQFMLTGKTSRRLDARAKECSISRSEFIERLLLWADEHWDGHLQRDLSAVVEGGNEH